MDAIKIACDDASLKAIIQKSINDATMHLGLDPGQDRVVNS